MSDGGRIIGQPRETQYTDQPATRDKLDETCRMEAYRIVTENMWGWEENASDELTGDQEAHADMLARELKSFALSHAADLEQQLTAAQQAKEAAEQRAEKAEREHEGTLKERVECEECIDKMYLDVVGQPAQWSNNFDYKDAADMVEQVAFARDQEIGRHINAREVAESRVYELEAENARLREQLAYLATDAGPDSDAAVIKQLREEVASVKRGYDQLDKNWHAVHESAMTAIRQMFCNPDATVPEICEEIGKLREKLTRVNQENRIKEEQVARCVQVVRGPCNRLPAGKWAIFIKGEVMAELIAKVQIMPHETVETLLAAYQSLEREWRKTITELNAIKAERKADLAALELNNKTLAERDKVIAAAVGYCKRHTHSGVTISAHVCLLDVLKILEGKE